MSSGARSNEAALRHRWPREGIRLIRDLPLSGGDALLLHTDLHAGNVLAADASRGWPSIPSPTPGIPPMT
jgi:hypothetical protein